MNNSCRINGVEYNFQEVKTLILSKQEWKAKEKIVNIIGCDYHTATNILSQIKQNNNEIPVYINTDIRIQEQQPIKNMPHCPICNSTNLSKISTVKKATKIGLFGIFGAGDIGKTYKCNNCGSRF